MTQEKRLARVKPGLSHAQYSAGDVFDASPDEWRDFGDKFEVVAVDTVEGVEKDAELDYTPPPGPWDEPTLVLEVTVPNATEDAVRVATELGVDLNEVQGSGQEGRIIVKDVRSAAAAGREQEAS